MSSLESAIDELRKRLAEKSQPNSFGSVSLEVTIQGGSVATLKITETITGKPAK
ncbi:MAG: hypothetical protein U0930_04885 [Pirellulales bacterium]